MRDCRRGGSCRHRFRCRRFWQPFEEAHHHTDGVGIDFEQWRFNLRKSNTEPLIRLNVEARGDRALIEAKTADVLALLGGEAA